MQSATSGLKRALEVSLANPGAYTEMVRRMAEADIVRNALDVVEYTEQITLTNAAFVNLTSTIPAGSVILYSALRADTLVVGDGSGDNGLTKLGLGASGDPDLYGLTGALTANSKNAVIPDWAVQGSALQLRVNAVNNSGVAVTEKFVAGGLVTVKVVYITPRALADYSA